MLLDAAYMAALFYEDELGITYLLLGLLDALYEEVILLSRDEHNGKLILLYVDEIFLQLELRPEKLSKPHPECD